MAWVTFRAMARPTPPPIPYKYPEWIAAGRPALEVSTQQLAEWLVPPLTKQRINDFCKRGDLFREKGKINTAHKRNADWLIAREGNAHQPKPPGRWPRAPKSDAPAPPPPVYRPSTDTEFNSIDLEVILEAISQQDLSKLNGADVQKIQRMESALKTRVEREHKRGLLIERSLVQTVFGRLYQIDSNQLKTLGAKLAPDLAGEFGIEDAAALLSVEQKIDTEVNKILSHIKHLLDDFLQQIGGQPV